MRETLKNRFESKCELRPSGCWIWTSNKTPVGYGQIAVGGKVRIAHRVSYEMYVGPVPDGLCVLHKCDAASCVNPDHLFLGTQTENMRDMDIKGRRRKAIRGGKSLAWTRLTDSQVLEIRSSNETDIQLAERYGISRGYVWAVRSGHRRPIKAA